MENARKYERHPIGQDKDALDQFEVLLLGESVRLVDFSAGGLYVLSRLPFSPGEIAISVSFKSGGKIDLIGNIVRVSKAEDMWGIVIDLSDPYDLNGLREA